MTFLFTTLFCLVLVAARLLRGEKSISTWCFAGGMTVFALEAFAHWLTFTGRRNVGAFAFAVQTLYPALWLSFSLTYCRGNASDFLSRWKILLSIAAIFPILFLLGVPWSSL